MTHSIVGMGRRTIVVTAVLALLGGCSSTTESIDGDWTFAEFTVDGVTQDVVVGTNTADQPWIVLDAGTMQGSSGCNQFTGSYQYQDGVLQTGAAGTRMWCGGADGGLMDFEVAFMQMMRGDPVAVSKDHDRMHWTSPNSTIVLVEESSTGLRVGLSTWISSPAIS